MIGTYVTNYFESMGYEVLGIVSGITADGSLVLENPRIGRWIAEPGQMQALQPACDRSVMAI